jgi:hypothetical protein
MAPSEIRILLPSKRLKTKPSIGEGFTLYMLKVIMSGLGDGR